LRVKALRSLKARWLSEISHGLTPEKVRAAVDSLSLEGIKRLDRTQPPLVAMGLIRTSDWYEITRTSEAVDAARARAAASKQKSAVVAEKPKGSTKAASKASSAKRTSPATTAKPVVAVPSAKADEPRGRHIDEKVLTPLLQRRGRELVGMKDTDFLFVTGISVWPGTRALGHCVFRKKVKDEQAKFRALFLLSARGPIAMGVDIDSIRRDIRANFHNDDEWKLLDLPSREVQGEWGKAVSTATAEQRVTPTRRSSSASSGARQAAEAKISSPHRPGCIIS